MKNQDGLKTTLGGLGIFLLLASSLFAVPQTINYQGLLEEGGSPVEGSRDVTFRIYDSSDGGSILWEEEQTVSFAGGVFSVILGSTEPISASVFAGGRRWLSLSIDDGPEILPRGELVSVGYALRSAKADSADHAAEADLAADAESADFATNAGLLDNLDSSQFAGTAHTHDSRYYRQNLLNTSDGSPPNEGNRFVHWDILTGVPEGFADGVDDTGAGATDHGQLTGLLDNDHPQYALGDSLRISDGSPPNEGRNMVHWNVLAGVPAPIADGTDDVTTDAGDIVTGTMSPERIEGVAVVSSDNRLLTAGQKNQLTGGEVTTLHAHDASQITTGTMSPERIEGVALVGTDERLLTLEQKGELTGGDTTALHAHIETGDISAVTAGEGLTGGGMTDSVEIAHAEDATALPFAHHYAPVVAHRQVGSFLSGSEDVLMVDSVLIAVPDTGFLYISFSLTQKLHIEQEGFPPELRPKRYYAKYGIGLDQTDTMAYSLTSSMQDTTFFAGFPESYVPCKPVAGCVLLGVGPGTHAVNLLTELVLKVESAAKNSLQDISLTVIYFPYDSTGMQAAMLGGAHGSAPQDGTGR